MHGRLLLTYNVDRAFRPHIHPLTVPGTELPLTRRRPVDHPWQYGVFTGLNLVEGLDFWCCGDPVYPTTKRGLIQIWDARIESDEPHTCALACDSRWLAPDGREVVIESQRLVVSAPNRDDLYAVDVEWALSPAAGPVEIGGSAYGGLSVRLVGEPHTRRHLSSAGEAPSGVRARWLSVAQPVDGVGTWTPETASTYAYAGVALLDHPHNFRFPNRWRVDDQGLINPAPALGGPFTVAEPLRLRYRLLAFLGPGDARCIEAAWREWAS